MSTFAELRTALAAATPTPWGHGNRGHQGGGVARTGEFTMTCNGASPDFIGVFDSAERNPASMANDDLIIAAVNSLAVLIDVAEAAQRVQKVCRPSPGCECATCRLSDAVDRLNGLLPQE